MKSRGAYGDQSSKDRWISKLSATKEGRLLALVDDAGLVMFLR